MSLRRALLFFITVLLVMYVFTFLHLPGNTLFWRAMQNSGHAIVFAGLAIAGFYSLMQLNERTLMTSVVLIGVGLSVLGLSIEVAQHVTGRGGSIHDLAFNSAGIIGGICVYAFAYNLKRRRPWLVSLLLVIIGTAAITWALRWPTTYFVTSLQRPSLPVLAHFQNRGSKFYVGGEGSTQELAQHAEWDQNPSRSLKVLFLPGRWPNVSFREPQKNWSTFTSISFLVFNPSPIPVSIRVRIDDRALGLLEDDHMTVKELVPKGETMVKLDFGLFREDALRRGRPGLATFTEIAGFMVFVPKVEIPITLYFDDFILE